MVVLVSHVGGFTNTLLHQNSKSSSALLLKMTKKQTVAVIGGGIAGLSCATALQKSGNYSTVTVFDTGRLRPGGRCSSRLPSDKAKEDAINYKLLSNTAIVDHAAQILTVPPGFTHFAQQVKEWEAQGIVKQFEQETVFEIVCQDPVFRLRALNDGPNVRMFHGVNGMGAIPLTMSKGINIQQDVWVSPSNGVKYGSNQWKVQGNGKVLGMFDKLVIAHNGKCADRLMSQTPATELHKLLQVNFSPEVPPWGGKKMTLNSIYSLTFALNKKGSPLSQALDNEKFICGFVKNQPNLRFLSCNTRKYYPQERDDIEIWTVLSSAKFAKKYKGPQENLPDSVVEEVIGLLLTSLEQSLNLLEGTLRGPIESSAGTGIILEHRLQLWGAGVPLNTWKASGDGASGFLYDAEHGVGTCGDWLLDPSIAGAWESGRRLAEYMNSNPQANVGLEGRFIASKEVGKVGIGSLK